jgi:hypothetical protein
MAVNRDTDSEDGMMYFFRRADVQLTSETRLDPDGPGYQLVITENGKTRIESFDTLPKLLEREHELLQAWRAQGWRDTDRPAPTAVDPWPGLR